MNVEWISSVAVIAADPAKSRELYVDALGLPLEPDAGGAIAPEPIASLRAVDMRSSETHTGGRAGAATNVQRPVSCDDLRRRSRRARLCAGSQ